MGNTVTFSARAALLETAALAFQQKPMAMVPLQNRAISSAATMPASAVRLPSLTMVCSWVRA